MDNGYDWERFGVHFVFGALLGGVIRLAFWEHGWPWIGGSSLVVALLGGIYGDRFWEWLLDNLRWLQWW